MRQRQARALYRALPGHVNHHKRRDLHKNFLSFGSKYEEIGAPSDAHENNSSYIIILSVHSRATGCGRGIRKRKEVSKRKEMLKVGSCAACVAPRLTYLS